MTKRPYIPLSVQRDAAILGLGLNPETAELHHSPALELRQQTELGSYIPDANDPHYLVWLDPEVHRRQTNGPGNEKRITTRGGDHGDAAHLRRLTKKEEAFRQRVLTERIGGVDFLVKPKRKIPSRGFTKRALTR